MKTPIRFSLVNKAATPIVLLVFSLTIPLVGCQTIREDPKHALPAGSPSPRVTIGFQTAQHVMKEQADPEQSIQLVSHAMPGLTLAQLEQIALHNNPTLISANARVQSAQGQWLQAGLCPNPVVGYHATEIGNRGTAGQQGGFISQKFITGHKLSLDRAVAGKKIQEARLLFNAQQQRVLSDVRVRFYNCLVAQRRLELTVELSEITNELVTKTKKLLEVRQVSENSLLQAEIEAQTTHLLFDNARHQHMESWRRLATTIGQPQWKIKPLDGALENVPLYLQWKDVLEIVLSEHPELQAAKTRVHRAELALTRAKREVIPNVDLSVSVRHHNVTDSDVVNVQMGIPLPIFDANQGNIHKRMADRIAAQSDLKRIELDLRDRLAVVYRQYANARQQGERYKNEILPRAKKSLDLVKQGYEKGQVGYLTLITAQRTYLRVNLAYLESLRELGEAVFVIRGKLLQGSLSKRS